METQPDVSVDALQMLEEEEADLGLFPCTVTTTCDLRTV
ncbi:ALQxL family class IV lanthipeptide [Streptomyces palmae]|nr:ALQxL family class IV lanthipeptide [Streptomyces palmae]